MGLDLGTLTGYLEMDSEKFEGVLEKLPDKIKGGGVAMGIAAAGVAALVGGSLAEGISTGMDLQDAQAHLTASLGLTQAESKRIGGIAGTLYSQAYGDSIDEVNDAVEGVVSSIDGMRNANSKAVSDMTAKVLNFNRAFGTDTERTTQEVGQLLKSGLVTDANTAMDLLTTAMQKVPKAVRDDVLDAADEYTPFFKQLGFSGSEMFNTLVEGSAKGSFGIDKAGDALKEFSIRATDVTDTNAQQAFIHLGLSSEDMANKILAGGKSAQDATQQIVTGLLGIKDPAQQAANAQFLFGTQIEDLNKGQLVDFLKSLQGGTDALGKTAGATDRMGKAVNGTASNGLKEFNRSWDMAVSSLTQQVVPILTDVLKVLNDHPALLKIVAVAVGVLALAFVGLTVATWAMNTALLANPITWIVLAIVAAVALVAVGVALLITHWQQVVDFTTGVFGAMWTWLQGLIQGFVDWWNGLWGTIGDSIAAGWNAVITWLSSIPGRMLAIFVGANVWLVQKGLDILAGLGNGIVTGAQAVWSWFTGLNARVVGFLAGAAGWLVGKGGDLLRGMATGISNGASAVWSFLSGLPGRILSQLGDMGRTLLRAGGDLMDGLLKGIKDGLGSILSAIGGMAGQIMSKFKSLLGIASPSKVFRSYGQFIGMGLVAGMSDLQGDIDSQVAGMVGAPNLNVSTSGSVGGSTSTGTSGGVSTSVVVQGNVGWDADEVADRISTKTQQAITLAGLEGLVGVK